ncbi:hypothetical protein Tco_0541687, partial [Tanacetum coccineum]
TDVDIINGCGYGYTKTRPEPDPLPSLGGGDGEGGLERFSRGVIGDSDRVISKEGRL